MNQVKVGVQYISENKYMFLLWSPKALSVLLKIVYPEEIIISMDKSENGYWQKTIEETSPGFRYFYVIDGTLQRPDPASSYQPEGVHGPSEIVNHNSFTWNDSEWNAPPLEKTIFYEIHTGTFTPEGTFDAIIPILPELKELGVTTIELMPVAQFPGDRNWGYDGVYPYAVQNSYGGPEGLKRLCDACHISGLALFLDVVYNHLGPEGNYLSAFGPYFTAQYKSQWSEAINFDGEYSDGVRNYFLMNSIHWFENYHIDGLRLDAVHSIFDMSAKHILEELVDTVKSYAESKGKIFYLIAESDLNNCIIIKDRISGGYGFDAQWSDDFHHSIHALITGEKSGYYQDFGKTSHLIKAFTEGFVYSGDYSLYRKRNHGNSSAEIPGEKLVIFIQNHDQTGNRHYGERLISLSGFEAHKLAAGALMTAPYIPLLFMGEEYAETAPFLYFISHGDPELVECVRRGRKLEFKSFTRGEDPPDPQSIETFKSSKPDRYLFNVEPHSSMIKYYKELIKIRIITPAINNLNKKNLTSEITGNGKVIILRRTYEDSEIYALMNFSNMINSCEIDEKVNLLKKIIDSADIKWQGPGSSASDLVKDRERIELRPYNFVLYTSVRPG